MGQILAHVANSQYQFCSAASGRQSPMTENLEETATTKAQITVALTDAFAFCNEVYASMSRRGRREDGGLFREPDGCLGRARLQLRA